MFDFLAVILSFIQSQSRFLFFIASFIKSSFLSSFFLFVLSYSILSVSHLSLQTCHFYSFEILFCSDIVLFSVLPLQYLFCIFRFSKLLFFFSLLHSFNTCILIERFGQTCMTKEQSEMLMLMNHPFARPSLHWAVRCTYRP